MQIELGKRQTLTVVKKVEFGVYLAPDGDPEEKVLLPIRQVPDGTRIGDPIGELGKRDS